jgi:hypothetical protein
MAVVVLREEEALVAVDLQESNNSLNRNIPGAPSLRRFCRKDGIAPYSRKRIGREQKSISRAFFIGADQAKAVGRWSLPFLFPKSRS